jgi:bifunctional pyridoxal-dependent enzyme with beta-cystathionase and maltose regulon repressor activities
MTLCEICLRHDAVICSDLIHCRLVLDTDRTHVPTATLGPEVADRTITLMSPLKTFNFPGLGCSFAIIPNEKLRRSFRAARHCPSGECPGLRCRHCRIPGRFSLADGADFRGPGFLRLTFGCPRSILVPARHLMQRAVELHGEQWR